MRSRFKPAIWAFLLTLLAVPANAADHLLLTEFAVTPTDAEFIEIYNPTVEVVDLTDYYISDFVLASDPTQNYWRMTDGALLPQAGFDTDFLARFPAGTTILPGQTFVVALHDDLLFSGAWSGGGRIVKPDFEFAQDGSGDGVADMVDPGYALIGRRLIQASAGLSNSREAVVLFHWDGQSDLVQDVDIVQWSNLGPDFNTLSPNKSGVTVDGPDADGLGSTYLADTPPGLQQVASALGTANDFGLTVSRVDFDEGTERLTAGNGLDGHDETSENYAVTWRENTDPSLGSPGEFGPPALLAARSVAPTSIELDFSRRLDPSTAELISSYSILQILSVGGEATGLPLAVRGAALQSDGRTVVLTTDDQVSLALYEIRVGGVLSDDLGEVVAPGTRALVRGFNPGPGLRLDVPRRPFVPSYDAPMEITYIAPQGRGVLLRVFDGEGRERFVLADELAPPGGLRTLRWDGRDRLRQRLPAGVYVLHLEIVATGEQTSVPIVVAVAEKESLR